MNTENHEVIISGKEYLEYVKFKKEKDNYEKKMNGELTNLRNALTSEKQKKEIKVTFPRQNHFDSRFDKNLNVIVYSVDSIEESKKLKETLMGYITPLTDELRKNRDKIYTLESDNQILKNNIEDLELKIKLLQKRSLFKRIFNIT